MTGTAVTLGPLFVDLSAPALSAGDRELLAHPLVGGVVLFDRNYHDRAQLEQLCRDIHALRDPRLIIAVDQEGGRVQRLREAFTRLPPMARLGALYDRDATHARELAEQLGWLMAGELLASGVDISFAPVLDLDRGVSGVIGDRALHAEPHAVSALGGALVRGMGRAGMAATGKHFPGHGSVREDSHVALPSDERDFDTLRQRDLVPFAHLARNGIAALMTAHVVYPRIDDRPVCFSARWLREHLRQRLAFGGAIVSDDLSMAGAAGAGDACARAEAALDAGCDVILLCNDRAGCERVVETLRYPDEPMSQLRRVRLHGRAQRQWAQLQALDEWRSVRESVARLDVSPELDI